MQPERIAQWLDDADDLYWALRLAARKFLGLFWTLVYVAFGVGLVFGGIFLALKEPPLAAATAVILFVSLLYRSVVNPTRFNPA